MEADCTRHGGDSWSVDIQWTSITFEFPPILEFVLFARFHLLIYPKRQIRSDSSLVGKMTLDLYEERREAKCPPHPSTVITSNDHLISKPKS